MTGYRYAAPRTALGLAAVAMTALTMGVFVALPSRVLPSRAESANRSDALLAASHDIAGPCVSASALDASAPGEDVQ